MDDSEAKQAKYSESCSRVYHPTTHYLKFVDYLNIQADKPLYINRGSYRSAHILLNLLNELWKRDKMRGLPSILPLFRKEFNKFNKFNNTGALILYSIYHMTLKLFWKDFFGGKR